MKNKLTLSLLLLLFGFGSSAQNCKEVIGYYPSWQWYDRNKLVNPESIDYSQYSIINYAFLKPLPDGSITLTDPWADKNLLLGSINWGVAPAGYDSQYDLGNPNYHHSGTSIVDYAHNSNTEVLISIGGWTLSDDFPAIAANPVTRSNFAHSCNELIRIYGADGIDIDWEYPGFEDHSGTNNDIFNYTLLLQEVRDSLDFLELSMSNNLKLTAAFGAAEFRMDDIEWDEVIGILDYINLMSYDFFGAWDSQSNHNSPLYAPQIGDTTFNCHSAVQRLLNTYNVPSTKINLGVAFYGRSAKTVSSNDLHSNITGSADEVTFNIDEGTPLYYNVMSSYNDFTEHWDDIAKAPYLTGNSGLNTFLSYDNEKSIGLKGKYIVDYNLGGAIIWEITGDYIETSPGSGIIESTPLADTLNKALCNAPVIDSSSSVGINEFVLDMKLFPNPTHHSLILNSKSKINRIIIFDLKGSIIQEKFSDNINEVDISKLEKGVYLIQYFSDENEGQKQFVKY